MKALSLRAILRGLTAGAVAAVASLLAYTVYAAPSFRPDIAGHFSSSTVLVVANGNAGGTTIVDGTISLTTPDARCVPLTQNGCRYSINGLSLRLADFSISDTPVNGMAVRTWYPVQDMVTFDGNLIVPPFVSFNVSGNVNGGNTAVTAFPPSPQAFTVSVNPSTQSISVNGHVTGSQSGWTIDVVFVATADTPLVNLPPIVNAGPDQSLTADCLASVLVNPSQSHDPTNNLASLFFRQGGFVLGAASQQLSLPAGNHLIQLVGTDTLGAESVDDLRVSVNLSGKAPTIAGATKVSLQTPNGLALGSVALDASQALKVGDRSKVVGTNLVPNAAIVNLGNTQTQLGVDSYVGDVWTSAPLFMQERAIINGVLRTTSTVNSQNGTQIRGGTQKLTTFSPSQYLQWNVTPFPTAPPTTDASGSVLPGRYGTLRVQPGSAVTLHSGVYTLDGLDLESSANMQLDQSAGPVVLYSFIRNIPRKPQCPRRDPVKIAASVLG